MLPTYLDDMVLRHRYSMPVAKSDSQVRYSGRIHNAALYRSARPALSIGIRH